MFKKAKLASLKPGEMVRAGGVEYLAMERDGRWSINVMIEGKRTHRVIGRVSEGITHSDARDAIAHLRAGVQSGVPRKRRSTSMTLTAAASEYLDVLTSFGGKNIQEKETHLRLHLCPELGHRALDRITEEAWVAYVGRRRSEGASPATVNRERSTLLHLLGTMIKRGKLPSMPCRLERLREPPGKDRYLTPKEFQALLAAARVDANPLVERFVMIGGHTGMRQEPILRMRVGDVNVKARTLTVERDKTGARTQPMTRALARYLDKLLEGLPADAFIFPSEGSKQGRVYQMNTQLRRCARRAGLPDWVTPHTLRHSMATNAAHAGVDPATIQRMGGWKTRAMVERYTHAAPLQAGMDALEQRLTRQGGPKNTGVALHPIE